MGTEASFTGHVEGAQIVPCSWNECSAGHKWLPAVALVKCEGCGGAALVVQKSQCPYCNEPIVKTSLRSDFVPRGAGVSKRCQGQEVFGEAIDIELERHQWREVEAGEGKVGESAKPFLERNKADKDNETV